MRRLLMAGAMTLAFSMLNKADAAQPTVDMLRQIVAGLNLGSNGLAKVEVKDGSSFIWRWNSNLSWRMMPPSSDLGVSAIVMLQIVITSDMDKIIKEMVKCGYDPQKENMDLSMQALQSGLTSVTGKPKIDVIGTVTYHYSTDELVWSPYQ